MKKKRGSSLLLVLGITFVLVTIGGVVVTSIMHTSSQHNSVKVESDLTYAAESGIEEAYSKIKSKTIALNNGDVHPTYNIDNLFTNQGIGVDIEVSRDSDKYTVVSTAEKGSKSEKVKGVLNINHTFVPGSNRVFKYVLCTNVADITCAGPLDGSVTLWNVKDIPGSSFIQDKLTETSVGLPVSVAMESNGFTVPDFNFSSTGSFTINQISDLDNKIAAGDPGIKKITVHGYKIYMVHLNNDTDTIKIENSAVTLTNTIFITNGTLKIGNADYKMTGAPTLVLDKSTYLANKLEMKISSFHSNFRIIDNDEGRFDALTSSEVDDINVELGGHINNWDGHTGSVGENIVIGDVEYID